jgi:hypothetical protein
VEIEKQKAKLTLGAEKAKSTLGVEKAKRKAKSTNAGQRN